MEAILRIMDKIRADDNMMDNQIESSIIFARRLGIDPKDDFNRHHRPRRAPKRVDEQAGTAAVLSLQQFCRKQLREVLDVPTSRMSEHLYSPMQGESFAAVKVPSTTNRFIVYPFCCFTIPTIYASLHLTH